MASSCSYTARPDRAGNRFIDAVVRSSIDQRADILWRHNSSALARWLDGTFAAGNVIFNNIVSLPIADLSWHIKGMADLNGNGPADIIFQHDSEAVVIWEMNASGVQSLNLAALNPGPEWHLVGVRDMTNDAKADILFQHDSGGAAIWQNYSSAG
jgi:hypothetical protein